MYRVVATTIMYTRQHNVCTRAQSKYSLMKLVHVFDKLVGVFDVPEIARTSLMGVWLSFRDSFRVSIHEHEGIRSSHIVRGNGAHHPRNLRREVPRNEQERQGRV